MHELKCVLFFRVRRLNGDKDGASSQRSLHDLHCHAIARDSAYICKYNCTGSIRELFHPYATSIAYRIITVIPRSR